MIIVNLGWIPLALKYVGTTWAIIARKSTDTNRLPALEYQIPRLYGIVQGCTMNIISFDYYDSRSSFKFSSKTPEVQIIET
jgi:hypothetical protein